MGLASIVWAAPSVPSRPCLTQRLNQRLRRDAIERYVANVLQHLDAGIRVRQTGAKLDQGSSRLFTALRSERIRYRNQRPAVVGQTRVARVAQSGRHFRVWIERDRRPPLGDQLTRDGKARIMAIEQRSGRAEPHLDDKRARQYRGRHIARFAPQCVGARKKDRKLFTGTVDSSAPLVAAIDAPPAARGQRAGPDFRPRPAGRWCEGAIRVDDRLPLVSHSW